MTKISKRTRQRAALLCQVAASNVGTENYLDEAVRLARLVDDYATNGTRHTMPGGYVADISRALVAVVAERNELLAEREHNLSRIDSLEEAVHAEHARAEHIGADLDNLRARAERADAERDDARRLINKYQDTRAASCARHAIDWRARCLAAEGERDRYRDDAERLEEKVREHWPWWESVDDRMEACDVLDAVARRLAERGEALSETQPLRDLCAVLNADGGQRQLFNGTAAAVAHAMERWYELRADERTRTAEEIAAWHDKQAGTWDASMNDKVSRARADSRRRVHEASAAHIRATWGTSVAEGESR